MPLRPALLLSTFVLFCLMPGTYFAVAGQVIGSSKCEASAFTGSWISSQPTVPFLSKLVITDQCKQVIHEPVALNNPWAGDLGVQTKSIYREYTVRPSSTCSPLDCVWGRSVVRSTEKGKLKAQFPMFLSKRYIELTRKGSKMLINWRIQFTGKRKPDQFGETLMVRAN